MSKCYIIGNGFDLYHGLASRYADFHRFVKTYHRKLEESLDNYFNFKVNDQYLWQSFESDLYDFDHHAFFEFYNHTDLFSESFRPSDVFGVEDEITENIGFLIEDLKAAFSDWIVSIEYPEVTEVINPLLYFESGSQFINFNYTDTLEILYKIPKKDILYLHNNANEMAGELIFGHGKKEEPDPLPGTFDDQGEPTRTMYSDAKGAARQPFYAFQKEIDQVLRANHMFFSSLTGIDNIIVLGHSFGEVDLPYFKEIAVKNPDAVWKISYYSPEEKEQIRNSALTILPGKAVEMITIGALSVSD